MPFNQNLANEELRRRYYVPGGALGWSVLVFVVCAITCIIFLMIRRYTVGGELGGGAVGRWASCVFLVGLWFLYIGMSILQNPTVALIDVSPDPDPAWGGNQHWASLFIYKPPWYVCREATPEEPQGMFCFKDRCKCLPKPGEPASEYNCPP